jgi:hypothetical protein
MRLGRELAHGAQKSRIPCRYHASGYCSKGSACQFAHEGPAGSSSSSGVARSAASQPESSTKAPCRFYAAGKCTRREWCPFAHEEAPKPPAPAGSVPVVQPRTDSRSQIPCQYFAKGYCRNGDACPFAHIEGDTIEGVDKEEADGLVVNVRCPEGLSRCVATDHFRFLIYRKNPPTTTGSASSGAPRSSSKTAQPSPRSPIRPTSPPSALASSRTEAPLHPWLPCCPIWT